MCIENTHFKCLKSYYRDSRVEITHLFLECNAFLKFSNAFCYIIANIKCIYIISSHSSRVCPNTFYRIDIKNLPRAPFFLDLALRARSCALRIHLSLFLTFCYWSSNQFYNNITDDVNYTFSQSHWISFWI